MIEDHQTDRRVGFEGGLNFFDLARSDVGAWLRFLAARSHQGGLLVTSGRDQMFELFDQQVCIDENILFAPCRSTRELHMHQQRALAALPVTLRSIKKQWICSCSG